MNLCDDAEANDECILVFPDEQDKTDYLDVYLQHICHI